MSETDFSWSDNESLVISSVDAVAVYTSPDGQIAIRQRDSTDERDAIIVLPRQRVSELIAALQKEASK